MTDNFPPLITIAIPTYNRADGYFKEALECALSQTYSNYEIIISDNFSSDNTEELVRSYDDRRIIYHKQQRNIAPNDNFNFCLDKANGKYFLLLHDDDLIDVDFLETCISGITPSDDIGIIRCGSRIINHAGKVIKEVENNDQGKSTHELFSCWLDGRSLMLLCSIIFNTEYLKKIGGFKSKYLLFQDVLTEFKLVAKYGRIDIRDAKGSFRKHPAQRTDNVNVKEWCEDSMYLLEEMCKLVPEHQALIYKKGLTHFSKHNYGLAEGIKSITQRYSWYLRIYKIFEYEFSPFQYFYRKIKHRTFSKIGEVKRNIIDLH